MSHIRSPLLFAAMFAFLSACAPTRHAKGPQTEATPGGQRLSGPFSHENLTIWLVHGVDRLSVVDASVIPDAPSGFPHVITIMLAEHLSQVVERHGARAHQRPPPLASPLLMCVAVAAPPVCARC